MQRNVNEVLMLSVLRFVGVQLLVSLSDVV